MTPAARAQAAIELLDAIILAAQEGGAAADTIVARYFRTRRYAGSGDRRAVRELVFRAIRRAGDLPESGRAALLGLSGLAGQPRPVEHLQQDASAVQWGTGRLNIGQPKLMASIGIVRIRASVSVTATVAKRSLRRARSNACSALT